MGKRGTRGFLSNLKAQVLTICPSNLCLRALEPLLICDLQHLTAIEDNHLLLGSIKSTIALRKNEEVKRSKPVYLPACKGRLVEACS